MHSPRVTPLVLALFTATAVLSACDKDKKETADADAKDEDKADEGGDKAEGGDKTEGGDKAEGGDAAAPADKDPTAGWVDYDSEEGRFSVKFPKAPKRTVTPTPTAVGNLDMIGYEVQSPTAYYAVMTVDYPEEVVESGDPKTMLDGARDGAVSNVQGKLTSEKELTMAGYPARRLQITASNSGLNMTLDAILVLAENRLLQAIVTYESGKPPPVEAFLGSFTVKKAEG